MRIIGFVFQNYNLIPTLTVEQNVAVLLHILKERKSEIREKVSKVLKEVGLEHRVKHYPCNS